jgi:hypothetical protein
MEEAVFSVRWSVRLLYNTSPFVVSAVSDFSVSSHMEAGSNTSTISLRVVGGDGKELSAWEYNWATLFLGDIYGDLALQVGGVLNLRVKYGHESRGIRARK